MEREGGNSGDKATKMEKMEKSNLWPRQTPEELGRIISIPPRNEYTEFDSTGPPSQLRRCEDHERKSWVLLVTTCDVVEEVPGAPENHVLGKKIFFCLRGLFGCWR